MSTRINRRAAAALIAGIVASAGAGILPAIAATQLTGAGSTFVYPFFSKAFYAYSQSHNDVTVNYQPIGSGGGIQQFIAKTVDFGASDVPMNGDELKRAGGAVVQVPVALGGEAVTYNLPTSIPGGLRLTREAVAEIYLGKISRWNDPVLEKLNPRASLPNMPIVTVHRSDGSGTTYIFTDFLSNVSKDWKDKVGTGKSVQWPGGNTVGGKGNDGVAGQVRQTQGAIGYVELAYAIENKMATAQLQNKSGKWLFCTESTVKAAAATKANVSATDFAIVDRSGDNAYPISGYTWAFVYENPADKGRAKLVRDVLSWVTGGDAQKIAGGLNYVPLPEAVQETAKKALAEVKV
ncbi:MAG TPA: phosphate ABC transporter substrate-binding protein PstS [Candidatus Elarobacter sp.]|nr:phosphate ABC transporter substrate-binding protein PstS [Candidatus Elarobacter sp.]HEV2741432.1 phosphate ABC transporter substrate-binding protein PstS [Candidatus Elarobacter sp.]